MDINYFPGRIRVRDAALRDDEIRTAALAVAKKLHAKLSFYTERKKAAVLALLAQMDGVLGACRATSCLETR